MPGLRRPQTRQTGAEACVSLPHEGQRIDPVVLRNIAILVRWRSVALVEPRAEVDEAAGERAERAVRVSLPRCSSAARGAGHGLLALPEGSIVGDRHGEDGRVVHLDRILRAPAKRVNSGTWRTHGERFSLTLIGGVAESCRDLSTEGVHRMNLVQFTNARVALGIVPILLLGLMLAGLSA